MIKNNNHKQTEIPINWQETKLGNLIKITRGASPRPIQNFLSQEGMPWVKIADATADESRYITKTKECIKLNGVKSSVTVHEGELIVSNSATPGIPKFMKITACVHDGWLIFREFNGILPEYVYYYMIYVRKKLVNTTTGSVFNNLKTDIVKNFEIRLPSIKTQKQIANLLTSFDDKIEVNNKIAKTLEEMAQALFKEWFVHFRFPGYEKVELVDSELGKIPREWRVGKVNDLIKIISGYPFSSSLYTTDKKALGVVTIRNVQDGDFITECDSSIKREAVPKSMNSECYLQSGDVLLSLTGNVGRVCFVYGGKYLLNQRVAKLIPRRNENLAYTYFLFRQNLMQNSLINLAKGSAQPNLSPVETSDTPIIVPTKEVLDSFNSISGPIYQKLVDNKNENQKLAALRDLLLPKLMKGEIRV